MAWNLFFLWVGTAVLAYALTPKPKLPKDAAPATIDDFDFPTAEDGREIPVLFGTRETSGPNVVWYGDLDTFAITEKIDRGPFRSSKRITTGYWYSIGMHMALTHGPVDSLNRIRVSDKVAWVGLQEGTGHGTDREIVIDLPDLFGGAEGEGGIIGKIHFLSGNPIQLPTDYQVATINNGSFAMPAFRGVASVSIEGAYVSANTPYLKPWAFHMTRTDITARAVEQWYVKKARIGSLGSVPSARPPGLEGEAKESSMLEDPPGFFFYNTGDTPCGSNTGNSYLKGRVRVYPNDQNFGEFSSDIPTSWKSATNEMIESGSFVTGFGSYPGRVEAVCLEEGVYYDRSEKIVTRRHPGNPGSGNIVVANILDPRVFFVRSIQPSGTGNYINSFYYIEDETEEDRQAAVFGLSCADMNPAHIIRECLTDKEWGMGYTDADIDDAAFTVAADTLYAEQLGISILWQRENTIEAFVQDIVRHIDAALYVDRRTGKFVLKLIRNDYDPNTLITLGPDQIERVENYKRPAFGDLVNSVTTIYDDCDDGRRLETPQ